VPVGAKVADEGLTAALPKPHHPAMAQPLILGGKTFDSRLLLGTGKFSDAGTMVRAIRASKTQLVTVALRRFNPDNREDDLMTPLSAVAGLTLMPNTSGARTADEAVRAAVLARELSGSPFVKVEIHPNPHHLMPDPIETYAACIRLVKEGFVVLPYMPADPVLAKRLEDIGCAAVMPLGSAIGSGHGLQTRGMVEMIVENSNIPVIVDAGLRSPSEAAAAMEMGCAAVLVNSAIAAAENPEGMAAAFALAVESGLAARDAGLMPISDSAVATSPLTSFLSGAPERE
jgi:thiazole synthase